MLAFMDEKCRTFRMRNMNLSWGQKELLRFWKDREQAFIRFGLMCIEEAEQRKVDYSRDLVSALTRFKEGKHWQKPLWAGWRRFHSDHREILLQLGEVERIYIRVQRHLGEACEDIVDAGPANWFSMRGFNDLAQGGAAHNTDARRYLDDEGIPSLADDECPNHYAQFNWSEEPDGEQRVYPLKKGHGLRQELEDNRCERCPVLLHIEGEEHAKYN
jgi:hypothetical protein